MSTTVKTFFRQVLLNRIDGLLSLMSSSAADEEEREGKCFLKNLLQGSMNGNFITYLN